MALVCVYGSSWRCYTCCPPPLPALQISVTFKNHQVLKDVSWEVKRGERVGLVGVNGAGKTTQLQVITGALLPDAGEVTRSRANMRIAYLTQEFDVEPSRTVREELMSVFDEQLAVLRRQEEIQKELEECGEDMDRMGKVLGEWPGGDAHWQHCSKGAENT